MFHSHCKYESVRLVGLFALVPTSDPQPWFQVETVPVSASCVPKDSVPRKPLDLPWFSQESILHSVTLHSLNFYSL